MGTESYLSGTISIDPPIPWKLLRDNVDLTDLDSNLPLHKKGDVLVRVDTTQIDTDEGVAHIRTGTALVPNSGGSRKNYYVTEALTEIVEQFGEGRTFTGYLHDENADGGFFAHRYRISPDLKVEFVEGQVEYPAWPSEPASGCDPVSFSVPVGFGVYERAARDLDTTPADLTYEQFNSWCREAIIGMGD